MTRCHETGFNQILQSGETQTFDRNENASSSFSHKSPQTTLCRGKKEHKNDTCQTHLSSRAAAVARKCCLDARHRTPHVVFLAGFAESIPLTRWPTLRPSCPKLRFGSPRRNKKGEALKQQQYRLKNNNKQGLRRHPSTIVNSWTLKRKRKKKKIEREAA